MRNRFIFQEQNLFFIFSFFILFLSSCEESVPTPEEDDNNTEKTSAIFLIIDEESIDNGNPPNNFTETDVNDQLAEVGLRLPLRYFEENVGKSIDLYTGQVGDEAWFALKAIPSSWKEAGPTDDGLRNYLTPGPGLGAPTPDDDREVLLDEIPNVMPLRATGLAMLKGETILALVYDSDISINYDPIKGNLQGANLGLVAFEVLEVVERTDGSDSSLPEVSIRIKEVNQIDISSLRLFTLAPVIQSSSEPFDVQP